jgi:hypothetical protein
MKKTNPSEVGYGHAIERGQGCSNEANNDVAKTPTTRNQIYLARSGSLFPFAPVALSVWRLDVCRADLERFATRDTGQSRPSSREQSVTSHLA